jgi:hypothetical protein
VSDYPGKACSSSCTCRKSSDYRRSSVVRSSGPSYNKAVNTDKVSAPVVDRKKKERSDWRDFVSQFMRSLLGLELKND